MRKIGECRVSVSNGRSIFIRHGTDDPNYGNHCLGITTDTNHSTGFYLTDAELNIVIDMLNSYRENTPEGSASEK